MQRDLVGRARAGDHDAFKELAASALARLHRTARLILRDEDRAADAVQDALMSAWLDIRALRDVDRFDAWLMRLLVNACYTEARRARRRHLVEVKVARLWTPSVDDASASFVLRDQLEGAFRRLTPDQRAVLVVHHYLGLREAEAAASLGIPVGTFKSRLNRATAALRAAVEAEDRGVGQATGSLA